MKYEVRIPFAGYCDVLVRANNEDEAIKKALESASINKDSSFIEFPNIYDLECTKKWVNKEKFLFQ